MWAGLVERGVACLGPSVQWVVTYMYIASVEAFTNWIRNFDWRKSSLIA